MRPECWHQQSAPSRPRTAPQRGCRVLREVRHRASTGQQAHSGRNGPGEWATPGSAQTGTRTGLEQPRDDQQPILTTFTRRPLTPGTEGHTAEEGRVAIPAVAGRLGPVSVRQGSSDRCRTRRARGTGREFVPISNWLRTSSAESLYAWRVVSMQKFVRPISAARMLSSSGHSRRRS